MKCYIESESVRLTGKGWEIRHYLRGVAATAPCEMTLADWLDRRYPLPTGTISGTNPDRRPTPSAADKVIDLRKPSE